MPAEKQTRRDLLISLGALTTALAAAPARTKAATRDKWEYFSLNQMLRPLARVDWDPGRDGILMVVAPESYNINGVVQNAESIRATNGKFAVDDLAASFFRERFAVGGITALVPRTRRDLWPTDPLLLANPFLLKDAFYESLSADQWRAAGSDGGLALNSLPRGTRDPFLAVLPDPVVVFERGGQYRQDTTISGDDRAGLRLRLRLLFRVDFLHDAPKTRISDLHPNDSWWTISDEATERPGTRRYWTVPGSPDPRYGPREPVVANRPKPSDLDVRGLRGRVSARPTDPARGTLSIRELVARCAAATGRDLRVDRRLGDHDVFVRGEPRAPDSLAAGDVLAALVRSVAGVFRRISEGRETVWLLTNDREGLLIQMARRGDAEREANARLWNIRRAAAGRREANPGDPFPDAILADAAKMGLPREFLRQIPLRRGEDPDEHGFSFDELPPVLREFARSGLAEILKKDAAARAKTVGPALPPLRRDRVAIVRDVRASVLLPDGREADIPWYAPEQTILDRFPKLPDLSGVADEPLPPWPSAWRRDAIVTAPDSGELDPIFAAASSAKLDCVFLFVTDLGHGDAREMLSRAIDAGRKHGVDVGLAASVFARPVSAKSPGERGFRDDLTLFGKTSDKTYSRRVDRDDPLFFGGGDGYLFARRPARRALVPTPELARARYEAISPLSSLPGLSALLLLDAFPVGYGERPGWPRGMISSDDLGFTIPNRLAYLRENGIDPVDLTSGWDHRALPLPFYPQPSSRTVFEDGLDQPPKFVPTSEPEPWGAFLGRRIAPLQRELHDAIRRRAPDLPILIEPGMTARFAHSWELNETPNPAMRLRHIPISVPRPLFGRPPSVRELLRAAISQANWQTPSRVEQGQPRAQGVLFDLTGAAPNSLAGTIRTIPTPRRGEGKD